MSLLYQRRISTFIAYGFQRSTPYEPQRQPASDGSGISLSADNDEAIRRWNGGFGEPSSAAIEKSSGVPHQEADLDAYCDAIVEAVFGTR